MDDIEQAAKDLETVISSFAFTDKRDHRIEVSFPFAEPVAQHLAERGIRVHPELAVIKPVRDERGVQVWIPVDDPEPDNAFSDKSPEQLAEMRDAFADLTVKLDAAIEVAKQHEGSRRG